MNVIPIPKDQQKRRSITERHIYTQEAIKLMKAVAEGETITYETLGEAIGLNVRPQNPGYCYQYSAREILERDNNIVFEVVPNIGLKRLTHDHVAMGTGSLYLKRKKALIKRSVRRISTINDHYDELGSEAKLRVTAHRTMLAFDSEISKSKNISRIEDKVKKENRLIGFQDTIKLFEK